MFFFILDFIKKVYPHFEREPLTQSQFKEILMYMQLATNNKTLFDRSKRSGDTKKFSVQPHENNINEEARLWRQQVKNLVTFQQCCGFFLYFVGSGSNKPFYFVHLNFLFNVVFRNRSGSWKTKLIHTDPYPDPQHWFSVCLLKVLSLSQQITRTIIIIHPNLRAGCRFWIWMHILYLLRCLQ